MESRTRQSPNFGKTIFVSRSLFSFGICDVLVLLELVDRSLVDASNLVWKEKSIRANRGLIQQTREYRTCPVSIPNVSCIWSLCSFYLFTALTLCCRVIASRYILYTLYSLLANSWGVYSSDLEFSSNSNHFRILKGWIFRNAYSPPSRRHPWSFSAHRKVWTGLSSSMQSRYIYDHDLPRCQAHAKLQCSIYIDLFKHKAVYLRWYDQRLFI
jgi:hypothetical protein